MGFSRLVSDRAWAPGSAALRFPAPEAAAKSLTRALLYAHVGTFELAVDLEAQQSLPPWQHRWPLVGIETQFGDLLISSRDGGGQLEVCPLPDHHAARKEAAV